MKLRIGCHPQKMLKLAKKAFKSKNIIPKLNASKYKGEEFYQTGCVYKELMGYVFVFNDRDGLVTVI